MNEFNLDKVLNLKVNITNYNYFTVFMT